MSQVPSGNFSYKCIKFSIQFFFISFCTWETLIIFLRHWPTYDKDIYWKVLTYLSPANAYKELHFLLCLVELLGVNECTSISFSSNRKFQGKHAGTIRELDFFFSPGNLSRIFILCHRWENVLTSLWIPAGGHVFSPTSKMATDFILNSSMLILKNTRLKALPALSFTL